MVLSFNKLDIIGLLKIINIDYSLIDQSLFITDKINIKKTFPIGVASLDFVLSAKNGNMILNITSATVLGNSMFGLVRKTAGDFIVKTLSSYKYFSVIKNNDGNIEFSNPKIKFKTINVSCGLISIDLDL
jgi:hypothetical protein